MATHTIKQCIIIGDNVSASISPAMHNAGYQALGLENQFAYSALSVSPQDLKNAIDQIRNDKVVGISVTVPHKITVMPFLDEIDHTAQAIGAVNTIFLKNGKLIGTNTDWLGILSPLLALTSIESKKIAAHGAGGAARAACYAAKSANAHTTIYNRSIDKAKKLALDFDCSAAALGNLSSLRDFDILVNSIPYSDESSPACVPAELLHDKLIVFDMVYKPRETTLLQQAKERGAQIIYGIEMLINQGTAQFEIYTGHKAPLEAMRQAALTANLSQ